MKLKLKALAAAMALAVAGTAQADIADFASGNGDLFLSIRDNTANTSLVFDLNVNMDNFLPSNAPNLQNFEDSTGTVSSFLSAGSGNYSWAVMAGDNNPTNVVDGIRYMSTTQAPSITLTNAQLQSFTIMNTDYLANVNVDLSDTVDVATYTSADNGFFAPTMDTWQGNATFSATAAVNDSQSFYLLSNSASLVLAANRARPVNQQEYLGTWTLASSGVLTYSAVPVPPAVWLLGSALLGLVGVARRKTQSA